MIAPAIAASVIVFRRRGMKKAASASSTVAT